MTGKILITGIVLWVFVAITLWRLWQIGSKRVVWDRNHYIAWGLLLLFAVILFFRPHEDIFGGQDTGAYLNGSVAFARAGALSYRDPMLAQLSADEMAPFVTTKSYTSKYHCLWLPDPSKPVMRTWFQPAFPIMAGVFTKLGSPKMVLFVIPLFAIFAGLAIRILALCLFNHPWAGETAFLFYILNPMIVWHVRYPRPEVIASFFIASGLVFLLTAWKKPRGTAWLDLLLGALCISISPFFHILSSSIVLMVSFIVVCIIISGRDDFFAYPLVASGVLALFLYQIFKIQDTYRLRKFVYPIQEHWLLAALLIVVAAILLYSFSWFNRHRNHSRQTKRFFPRLRLLGAVVILAVVSIVAWSAYHTSVDVLKLYITRFIWRTDLRCVVEMVSLPIALIGLCGLIAMSLRSDKGIRERWVVLAVMVPTSLMIGNMYDFFLTRYMLVSLLPLLVLSLTAMVTLIPVKHRLGQYIFTLAVIGICLLGINNRTLLIRHVQFKGLADYLSNVAAELKKQDAILLFEYPRLAAPLDLFYGVPTLSLNNERLMNYEPAEKNWLKIMRNNPDKPAYFITPFKRKPISELFDFIPCGLREYHGRRIVAKRWDLPVSTCDWGCGLRIYKMITADPASHYSQLPWASDFGYGNMGIRNFRQPRLNNSASILSRQISQKKPIQLDITATEDQPQTGQFWMIACSEDKSEKAPQLSLKLNGKKLLCQTVHLINEWSLVRSQETTISGGKLEIYGSDQTVLSTVRMVSGNRVTALFDAWQDPESKPYIAAPFSSRWTEEKSEFIVPASKQETTYLLTFTLVPHEWGEYARLHLSANEISLPLKRVPTSSFAWEIWPLDSAKNKSHVFPVCMESKAADAATSPNSTNSMPVALGYVAVVE